MCVLSGSSASVAAVRRRMEEQFYSNIRELTIPGIKIGRVIGQGGEGLKRIQVQTGATVYVFQVR
jgi:polyribonucleotide nucleotidyltransferase